MILNSFIHTIMYTYYGITSMGFAYPGKPLITMMQVEVFPAIFFVFWCHTHTHAFPSCHTHRVLFPLFPIGRLFSLSLVCRSRSLLAASASSGPTSTSNASGSPSSPAPYPPFLPPPPSPPLPPPPHSPPLPPPPPFRASQSLVFSWFFNYAYVGTVLALFMHFFYMVKNK